MRPINKRIAVAISLITSYLFISITSAQIVSDVTGQIDLMLDPFFDIGPLPTGNGDEWDMLPLETQHQYTSVGMMDVNASFDGDGYYSADGLNFIDYTYESKKPSTARFDIHAFADTEDAGDGGGGYANINMQITFSQPVQYRFEADVIGVPCLYEVSFNGRSASARYSAMGIYGGSFPPVYHYDNPLPDGWDTYIDEGVLPAGTYELTVTAHSTLHRYGIGLDSEGSASLSIQLLGDANLNGHVGLEDLNAVLNHWQWTSQHDRKLQGDLNNDGYVGLADLDAVLTGWGSNVRKPSHMVVPEPAIATLLLTALGVLLRRRTV